MRIRSVFILACFLNTASNGCSARGMFSLAVVYLNSAVVSIYTYFGAGVCFSAACSVRKEALLQDIVTPLILKVGFKGFKGSTGEGFVPNPPPPPPQMQPT